MKIVSERSERELAEERAKRLIEEPLRQLASNILRVIRGAGKAWQIASEAAAVLEAFEEYRSIVGRYPSEYEIHEVISMRHEAASSPRDNESDWSDAIDDMIAGGLQMAASRLAGQLTQERAGQNEMFKGLFVIEKIREENRREFNSVTVRQRKKPK